MQRTRQKRLGCEQKEVGANLVLTDQLFLFYKDGQYGRCPECGEPVVIPGLSKCYCGECGWVALAKKAPENENNILGVGSHDD